MHAYADDLYMHFILEIYLDHDPECLT